MALTEKATAVDAIALKSLTYRDVNDRMEDPLRWHYQFADRGQKIQVRSEDVDRFVGLGAITTDLGSKEAELAAAGAPAGSPGISTISNPSEAAQVRAVTSATSMNGVGPGSTFHELMGVATPVLRLMAKGFGVELDENDSKEQLVKKLTKRAEGVEEITQERDQIQLAARESGGERGLLATNALAGGRNAETGEKLDTSEKSDTSEKRSSGKKD